MRWSVPDAAGGVVAAALACSPSDADTLAGYFAECIGDRCQLASATFHRVATYDADVALDLELRGELGGPADWPEAVTTNVRHRGAVAYVVRQRDGLRIVDVADPAAPVDVGFAPSDPDEIWNDVKLRDGPDGTPYALVASSTRGVVVLDVSDPGAPREITSFPPAPASVHTLALDGARAYLADTRRAGLTVYDVADPAAPVALGGFTHASVTRTRDAYLHDLYVEDGRAYLAYWTLGLVIADVSGLPEDPVTLVGSFATYDEPTSHSVWPVKTGGRTVLIHGDEGFGAHIRFLADEKDDGLWSVVSSFQTRPAVSAHNVMAVGTVGLLTYYQDGLRVVDLADAAAPREIAHYGTWDPSDRIRGRDFYEGAIGVDVDEDRGLILVADTGRGLLVLQPSAPLARRLGW
jgi:hypothetical protein